MNNCLPADPGWIIWVLSSYGLGFLVFGAGIAILDYYTNWFNKVK